MPVLVGKDLFDAVESDWRRIDVISGNARREQSVLLSGLLVCGRCGAA